VYLRSETKKLAELKSRAWEEVAEFVGLSANSYKSHWQILREKFARYDNKWVLGKHVGWRFFDRLSFLRPHLLKRIGTQGVESIFGSVATRQVFFLSYVVHAIIRINYNWFWL